MARDFRCHCDINHIGLELIFTEVEGMDTSLGHDGVRRRLHNSVHSIL